MSATIAGERHGRRGRHPPQVWPAQTGLARRVGKHTS